MYKLGISEEDAKKHTSCSTYKINVTCPYCKKTKNKKISDIHNAKTIGCSCSDGKSYLSKYLHDLLTQLNIKFETEVKYKWNIYKTLDNKIHKASIDFVISYKERQIPLEADGAFHRKDNDMNGQTKEESEYIDKQRDCNCLKYLDEETIRISDVGNIKDNILNSKLSTMFNLSSIDWYKCERFALSNFANNVCGYWNNKKEFETTADLSRIFCVSSPTIRKYLKKGNELGWCLYDSKKEQYKTSVKNGKNNGIKVEIFKEGKSLGVFDSCADVERESEKLFGIKLFKGNIASVCRKERAQHKGYTFKYVL
jgi:hypothetical protein